MAGTQVHQAPHPLQHVLFVPRDPIQVKEQPHVACVPVAGHLLQREPDRQPLVASAPKALFLVAVRDHARYAQEVDIPMQPGLHLHWYVRLVQVARILEQLELLRS